MSRYRSRLHLHFLLHHHNHHRRRATPYNNNNSLVEPLSKEVELAALFQSEFEPLPKRETETLLQEMWKGIHNSLA